MIRDDISSKLIHLTKGESIEDAASIFYKIINSRKLIGSNGYIKDSFKCVCFSEVPLNALAQILASPNAHDFRYMPFGIMVEKEWLFLRGGRPVIYQPDQEYDLLPYELRYRHVRYEPHRGIDYSWEREWRIWIDELWLEPDNTTLVVPNREWVYRIKEPYFDDLARQVYYEGEVTSEIIADFPWHLITLEDLGIKIDWMENER